MNSSKFRRINKTKKKPRDENDDGQEKNAISFSSVLMKSSIKEVAERVVNGTKEVFYPQRRKKDWDNNKNVNPYASHKMRREMKSKESNAALHLPIHQTTSTISTTYVFDPFSEVAEIIMASDWKDPWNTSASDHVHDGNRNEEVREPLNFVSLTSTVVDIRTRYGKDEVEIIASYDSDDDDVSDLENDEEDKALHQSASFFLNDPVESENQRVAMTLKVLRGKDLPFDNARLRIAVLNEFCVIEQLLGTTPSSQLYQNPIWGTRKCSWSIMGKPSTQILFTLEEEEVFSDRKVDRRTKGGATNKPHIFAKVYAAELTARQNPNCWLRLFDYGPTQMTHCGRIQVRLTRPMVDKQLHQQENCPRITPGPAFPSRMQSYAIRKKVMYSCSPVVLNVYDVSNDTRVVQVNNTVKSVLNGGIFHAAIEIHGKEYSFGGTHDKRSNLSGVFTCVPKRCPMHHYRESVYLGDCELSPQQVHEILDDLRRKWMARSYNLFRKNCAFFSREFAIELGVGDIPEWVFSLAATAEIIEPYAMKLNKYFANRTKVRRKQQQEEHRKALQMEASEKMNEIFGSKGNMESQRVVADTQELLFDHAMAARIQRSFRATSKRLLAGKRGQSIVAAV